MAKFIFFLWTIFHHVSIARAAQRSDKLAKIGAAWTYARSQWQPKNVMKLDADDLISSRLVGWLDENETEAGYLHSQLQFADVPGSYSADKIHHRKFRKEFMIGLQHVAATS